MCRLKAVAIRSADSVTRRPMLRRRLPPCATLVETDGSDLHLKVPVAARWCASHGALAPLEGSEPARRPTDTETALARRC